MLRIPHILLISPIKARFKAFIVMLVVLFSSSVPISAQSGIPSRAGTTIVNGVWDGSTPADAPGELTISLNGVYFGEDSQDASDSVKVDTVYAFSSLDSLDVPDDTAANYENLDIRYIFQNYGNLSSDSFYVLVTLSDTSFIPNNLLILNADSSETLGQSNGKDTASYGVWLAQEEKDTFLIRVVVPGPDTAQDGDSVIVNVNTYDSLGSGGNDAWPLNRLVLDTSSVYSHTDSDTLQDFGDTQGDACVVWVIAPRIRLFKRTTQVDPTNKPGDRLIYTIYYDNDGGLESGDTTVIIDYLPNGIAFDTMLTVQLDTATRAVTETLKVKFHHRPSSTWLDSLPYGRARINSTSRDTIWNIDAIKFLIPEGIGTQSSGAVADDANDQVADDSLDRDAGYVKFRVRIR
jgi:uncharacterized repeat protein (TIGR01451 family)